MRLGEVMSWGMDANTPRESERWISVQMALLLIALPIYSSSTITIVGLSLVDPRIGTRLLPLAAAMAAGLCMNILLILLVRARRFDISVPLASYGTIVLHMASALVYSSPIHFSESLLTFLVGTFFWYPSGQGRRMRRVVIIQVTLYLATCAYESLFPPLIDLSEPSYLAPLIVAMLRGALVLYVLAAGFQLRSQMAGYDTDRDAYNARLAALVARLRRYLPEQFVQRLLSSGEDALSTYERRKITVFFSDIKDFTPMTEFLEPEELAALLNEYLGEMAEIARRWGGTVDKFVGDAVMVFFGAPDDMTESGQARHCVGMALEMLARLKELRRQWFDRGVEGELSIRIGLCTGMATVGTFGAKERGSYTAIGRAFNLAARLQTIARPDGIVMTHSTYVFVKDAVPCARREATGALKGIEREVITYDVEVERAQAGFEQLRA